MGAFLVDAGRSGDAVGDAVRVDGIGDEMIAFLAVCAGIGALASVLRLVIAWLDFQYRWRHLPSHYYGKKGKG